MKEVNDKEMKIKDDIIEKQERNMKQKPNIVIRKTERERAALEIGESIEREI